MTVWKYPIDPTDGDEVTLELPAGARVLSFGVPPEDAHAFAIWVLVDPNETEMEKRYFRFAGTGHPIYRIADDLTFIGTVKTNDLLMFHLFEVSP